MNEKEPLAFRMRPKTLEEYVGQEHVIGPGKLLYRTIKADRLSSIILFGPPGCGKTSLAKVISETTKYKFYKINAVTAGVADIKRVVEETRNYMMNPTGKSILFIDEIHRFNKLQQDALLPYVENGTIILIGATTENPYFEVNKALISRSMVIKLNPLTEENIYKILKNALERKDGLGEYSIKIEDSTLRKIADISNGDVRTALNGLEIAVLTTSMSSDGYIHITDEVIKNSIQIRNPVNQPGRTGTLRTGEIIVIKNLKIIIYFRFIGTGKFSKIKTKIKFLCIQILHKRYRYNDSPVCSQGIIEA